MPRAALVLALIALALKLWLASTTWGTNDVETFRRFLEEHRAHGAVWLYAEDRYFTHPPLVIRMLQAIGAVADRTALSWPFCLRLPAIVADLGIVLVLARLVRPEGREKTALALVAIAPAAIFVSGFHGNTDSVMILLVLLSLLAIERGRPGLAGASLGLALSVKVVPLIFLPAIVLSIGRGRVRFLVAMLAVVLAGSIPVLFQEPGLVLGKVLGYRSAYGVWGLAHLAKATAMPEVSAVFKAGGRWLLAALIVALSLWMRGRAPLYRQLGVILLAFFALTPGFSVQYLVWIAPWIVLLPLPAVAVFVLLAGAFLGLVYTFWTQDPRVGRIDEFLDPEFWRRGLPWDAAYADRSPWWSGSLVPFEVATYLAVLALLALAIRDLRAARMERGCASSS